ASTAPAIPVASSCVTTAAPSRCNRRATSSALPSSRGRTTTTNRERRAPRSNRKWRSMRVTPAKEKKGLSSSGQKRLEAPPASTSTTGSVIGPPAFAARVYRSRYREVRRETFAGGEAEFRRGQEWVVPPSP